MSLTLVDLTKPSNVTAEDQAGFIPLPAFSGSCQIMPHYQSIPCPFGRNADGLRLLFERGDKLCELASIQ